MAVPYRRRLEQQNARLPGRVEVDGATVVPRLSFVPLLEKVHVDKPRTLLSGNGLRTNSDVSDLI